jgi:hypothetical protein
LHIVHASLCMHAGILKRRQHDISFAVTAGDDQHAVVALQLQPRTRLV